MPPYLPRAGFKIAPFKRTEIQPYGAFANTTKPGKYPINQTISLDGQPRTFNWPSSEHAFHAQKILYLKQQLTPNHDAHIVLNNMLSQIEATNEEFLPRKHYDSLVNKHLSSLQAKGLNVHSKSDFDALCGADYHPLYQPQGQRETLKFMREVTRLKLQQHPDLKAIAIECAKEGILPVEVSQHDHTWASGPNGHGENMLGIIILEEANALLRSQGEHPSIPNPEQTYKQLMQKTDLSHNTLEPLLDPKTWIMPTHQTAAHNRATQNPAPQAVHSSKINLQDSGTNLQTQDRYFLDSNTGITLVQRADGGHHFSKNRQTIQVPPQYEKLMLQEYTKMISTAAAKQPPTPTKPQLQYSGTNGKDHYYTDKNTDITLVQRANGGHHFSKNRQTIQVPPQYEKLMLQEYTKMISTAAAKQPPTPTKPQLQYSGTNGKDHYYTDKNTDITLVQRANGDHHFSKNRQTIQVSPQYEKLMVDQVEIAQRNLKKHYQHSNFEGSSRMHWSKASIEHNQELKEKYHALKGDALKSSILMDFKLQLENCTNQQEFDDKVQEIKDSKAYQVLAQSQGIATSVLKLKTSSIIALDEVIEQCQNNFTHQGLSMK